MDTQPEIRQIDKDVESYLGAYLVLQICDFKDRISGNFFMQGNSVLSQLTELITKVSKSREIGTQKQIMEDIDSLLSTLQDLCERMVPRKKINYLLPVYMYRDSLLTKEDEKIYLYLDLLCNDEATPLSIAKSSSHDLRNSLYILGGEFLSLNLKLSSSSEVLQIPQKKSESLKSLVNSISIEFFKKGLSMISLMQARLELFTSYIKTPFHISAAKLLVQKISNLIDSNEGLLIPGDIIESHLSRLQSLFLIEEPHITPLIWLLREAVGWECAEDILINDPIIEQIKMSIKT